MIRRKHKHGTLARVARIAAALACALSAFQLAGCVLEKLNAEMKRQVNAEVDRFIAGDEMTTDQRLVARAVGAMNGGAYYEAEALLDSAVQINPDNRVALLNLGAVYEATTRREKALQVYTQLADPLARPVTGAGIADNDVARLAAGRLAVLEAGRAPSHFRKAAINTASSDPAQSFSRASASAPAEPAAASTKAAAATSDAATPGKAAKTVLVTLSSHPSEAAAKGGWDALAAKHGAVLGHLRPIIAPIDRGDGKGEAYRLATGPFASAREAATFCDKLLARRVYCLISSG
jgi:tetratricopeptide (TPR) repeat protein